MLDDTETIVGLAASFFTAVSLIPQLVKIIKSKKAEDVSLAMLGTLFTGLCLWIWYGVLKDDIIIILSNAFSILINLTTVLLSCKYKTHNEEGA